LRWQHPSVGDVPPGLFIPLLEEARLISRLTSWIYQQGAAQRSAWNATFRKELVLSISLSNAQFSMPNLAAELQRAIVDNQLSADQLEIEVVEASLMHNPLQAREQLQQLKGLGVKVALDDFGSGNCSVKMLRDLPIDTLKLDRQLISRLPDSAHDAAMAKGIIEMCLAFNITVIAEGVETHEQYQWLRDNGCQFVQGFVVAKPMTATDAGQFTTPFEWGLH
jgi:EAL domain-containing protein (putative c-di-GMP-specific phosphodiesterase class I)